MSFCTACGPSCACKIVLQHDLPEEISDVRNASMLAGAGERDTLATDDQRWNIPLCRVWAGSRRTPLSYGFGAPMAYYQVPKWVRWYRCHLTTIRGALTKSTSLFLATYGYQFAAQTDLSRGSPGFL